MSEDDGWLTFKQAADYLRMSPKTFAELVERGDLLAIYDRPRQHGEPKPQGRLVHRSHVDAWAEGQRAKAAKG